MHSIRIRITSLMMTALLISVLLIGTISYVSLRRDSEREAETTMRLLCDNCCEEIDSYFNTVEHSVDTVAHFAAEQMDSARLVEGKAIGLTGDGALSASQRRNRETQKALDEYLAEYTAEVEDMFRSVANHTDGVAAFYFRINPEISKQEEGFLYSRIDSASYNKIPGTAIGDYQRDDTAHVGWYYIPIERGRPSWIGPYQNENLNIRTFSYEMPLYKAGSFIGVIGMDISYETLVNLIKDIRIYDTGFAFLVQEDGTVVYHPYIDFGGIASQRNNTIQSFINVFRSERSNEEAAYYVINGERRQMMFGTLSSGLRLVVTVAQSEVEASGRRLAGRLLITSLIIMTMFGSLSAMRMKRMISPLVTLTDAAEHLSKGEYDIRLDYDRDDEIGTLTRTFQQLVDHLKIYISDLNSKAYQDAMTGVRNKGAFNGATRILDDAILSSEGGAAPEFAIIMFDCNNLKTINDTCGHEKGDMYLRRACKLICEIFTHSPVFRVGGDEFTVILQDDSYRDREALLRRFDERTAEINAEAQEPWDYVRIAKGVAVFDGTQDKSAGDVLHRADEQMYEDKKRSKAGKRQ
ncbi:MAG: diguanylate cyclase [Ruminococcaceae bacterium]|nr:diguanylate cyclase [Oscillospiraceae bacterium]